ncbi:MAG: 30S ribosomal protein S20 [Clostridiaceae bacterium]|nr:30S ribosomal protein S20 [Clostridiaceae bacterium]
MPNTKKAIKRVKIAEKKRLANVMRKSALRTAIKKCRVAIQNKDPKAKVLLDEAIKALDKAAAKDIIHKNTAARTKSRLTRAFNMLKAPAAATVGAAAGTDPDAGTIDTGEDK